ncbi:DUF4302 domain-containing protein [Pedobacter sp. N36a]|uniref:DUF4302 domain-containing protein n=1 Tax=Pedobacter sp. N36a TaxID=2767996 RepID=UPI001656B868|nr:DUF4302 domain-containing protein [Pedobacter sp. N36a]MBC8987104.1 DUF4302 domain-containing protein [Pedobacter sp. N36a]
MKRFLLYIVLLSAGFITGCKKDENPILDDPDQRVAAALVEHQAELLSAENGWKGTIYPKLGKGFSFYFKFDKEGKVKMLSDFNTTTAVTLQESTYRLKALQFPTLMFDTYNYIHLPADPNGSISGGTNGKGLTSDFEFAFDGIIGDTLKMRGIVNGNLMNMVKLSGLEEQAIIGGGLNTMRTKTVAFLAGKFPYVMLDNKQVPVSIGVSTKSFNIGGVDNAFAFAIDGLELKNPIVYGAHVFKKVLWDATDSYFYLLEGTTKFKVVASTVPLILDKTPALHTLLGTRFTSMKISPAVLPDLSADFLTRYNAVATSLPAIQGLRLDYMTLLFTGNNQMILRVRFLPAATNSTTFYDGDFYFNMAVNDAGVAQLTGIPAPVSGTTVSNGEAIRPALTPFINYLNTNAFKVAYIGAAAPSGSTVGGFLSETNPNSYFYGVLAQ